MAPSHPQDPGDREELLSAILRTVADAILIVDEEGMVRYANPAAEQIFGRALNEIVDHPFGLPVSTGDTTEVDIVHPGGGVIVAELRTVPLMLDGKPGYIASIRDVKTKSNFLAIMSHELRTPLNAVIGYADLLTIGVPKPIPPEAQSHVERIRASAQHLLEFIDEILSFSTSHKERARLDLESTSVRDVAHSVANLIEPLARERHLEFALGLPDADYTIQTDRARVQQILLNLLSNAIKFTPQGRIELNITRSGDWTHFEIRDTGIGIATENLDRIFDPFWQAEQTRTRTAEGAGLGLSLAKRLAQSLGANLVVRSGPGEGSSFTLQLPNHLPVISLVRDGGRTKMAK
jgi:signal transduction histidine kinase